jgi:glycosyltransferase involved in cell wall biosynthesis
VIGGYDLANIPASGTELGYGHQRGGAKKWISRATMFLANALITNSHYSEKEAWENAGVAGKKLYVVYHGVPDVSGALSPHARDRMAITVGNVERPNLWRKGLEPFVRSAKLLPDVQFVVVGAWKDDAIAHLKAIATPNVKFTGWVHDEALLDYNRRASVYVQASRHEGFGMAVAEAMLAGCIPVVTSEGALPEVVGDCGVYSASAEPNDLAAAIGQALQSSQSARDRARQRVLTQFPSSRRQALLSGIVSQLAARGGKPPEQFISSSVRP